MIPEEKNDDVVRALWEAFGVTEFEAIQPLTAGLSRALVFRIVVRGRPYVLRLVVNTDGAVGPGQGNQAHHFACMKLAAEVGIAPRVWYTSAEDGISITDFVARRPFPRTRALALLPATLKGLHAQPPFPSSRTVNYLDTMDGLVGKLQAAGSLTDCEAAEIFELYAQARDAYPRVDLDMVPSHNDLRPENILFDGERVWLVDWEAAFTNDRYLDLAVVSNFVVANGAEEEAYLQTYFGGPAGQYRQARFYLMGQLVHMFYAAFLMVLGAAGKPIELNAKAPDFRNFHDRIWAGDVSLGSKDAKLQYASVHVNQFLQNAREARFHDALEIVSIGR
jgi:aminoglycoside phosphotransferase (APT) family kinase protein